MNMQKLMQEAQKMQRVITEKQDEIFKTNYEGKSGFVTVVLSGKKEMVSIKIDTPSLTDAEDIDALQDMIKIAHNEAVSKIDKDVEVKLGAYAKGLNGLM